HRVPKISTAPSRAIHSTSKPQIAANAPKCSGRLNASQNRARKTRLWPRQITWRANRRQTYSISGFGNDLMKWCASRNTRQPSTTVELIKFQTTIPIAKYGRYSSIGRGNTKSQKQTHGENHERGIERHPEWPKLSAPVPQFDVRPGERRPATEICKLRHGADGAFSQSSQHAIDSLVCGSCLSRPR